MCIHRRRKRPTSCRSSNLTVLLISPRLLHNLIHSMLSDAPPPSTSTSYGTGPSPYGAKPSNTAPSYGGSAYGQGTIWNRSNSSTDWSSNSFIHRTFVLRQALRLSWLRSRSCRIKSIASGDDSYQRSEPLHEQMDYQSPSYQQSICFFFCFSGTLALLSNVSLCVRVLWRRGVIKGERENYSVSTCSTLPVARFVRPCSMTPQISSWMSSMRGR